mgnify:CR=1 FL=1
MWAVVLELIHESFVFADTKHDKCPVFHAACCWFSLSPIEMNYNICWYRQGVILLLLGTDNTYYSYFVPTVVFHANPGPTSETIFTP